MEGFYWLIEGVLGGCPRPGNRQRARTFAHDPGAAGAHNNAEHLGQDLLWLRSQGIGALLSLTEEPLPDEALPRSGLETLHLPVPDLTAPTHEQFQQALAFIDWHRSQGRGVAVHCLVGQGRTGTVLAAYLIRRGLDVDQALADVRSVCPGAVGSLAQERALKMYAEQRGWFI